MPGRLLGGTFEIHKGDFEGDFCFRFRTSGGSILMESVGGYRSKDAVERAIQFVAGSAARAKVVDLTEDGGGSL